MSKQNKRKKWIQPRHNLGKFVVGCYAYPKMKLKYGIKIEPFKDANRQYLILYNRLCLEYNQWKPYKIAPF